MTRDELRTLIIDRMDPSEVVEVLDISTEELVDALDIVIYENRDKFYFLEGWIN